MEKKMEPKAEIVEQLEPVGPKEYNPLEWETTLAHVKIVKNEKVRELFKKDSLGVYFDNSFFGTIERANGNERWSAIHVDGKGRRIAQFKRMTDALFYLLEEALNKALGKHFGPPVKKSEDASKKCALK